MTSKEILQELHILREENTRLKELMIERRFAQGVLNVTSIISSSLSAAQQLALPPKVREEMFAIAAEEATRLENLTKDFLAYTRVHPLEKRVTSVSTSLAYVASIIKAQADHFSVIVDVESSKEDRVIWVDSFKVYQGLLHLAKNAVEAAPQNTKVTLGTLQEGHHMMFFFVENTGISIPDDNLDRIFEPFFTTKPKKNGLGLSITRNIARAHGGDVQLTVNEPNRIRFVMNLPVESLKEGML